MDELEFILPDRPSQHYSKRKRQNNFNDSTPQSYLWVDKYEPKDENDICIHHMKLKETKEAIAHSSIGDKADPIKILLLSGPTGCGKSTLIRVLCKSMDFDLIEWQTPINEYDPGNYVHNMTLFTQFLNSCIRRETMNSKGKKKIIFVDDIPDMTTEQIKQKFHFTLQSCLSSSVSFLLVLVVSEAWISSSVYKRNFDEKLNRITDIIPKELEQDRRVRHIKYNPVSPGNMKKILAKIMDCEDAKLSNSELRDILDKADGDIRTAINHIQFYAKRSLIPISKQSKTTTNESNSASFDEKIGHLDLFHALGKVLYGKRNSNGTYESKPEHILNKIPVDSDTFVTYLHANCLHFFNDIESCAKSMEYLSDADLIRSESDWQENSAASAYRSLVTVHGIMTKEPKKSKLGFFSIQKPALFDIQYTLRQQKLEQYQEQLMQSVQLRMNSIELKENNEFNDDPIQDFSEDEFDDIYGDGSDLAFLGDI